MFSDHLSRQLRFVVPGACITLWLRTPSLIERIWAEAAPFARFVSVFVALSVTLIIFLLPLQVTGRRVSTVGLANDRVVFVYPFDSCDQGNSTRCASLIIKFQSRYICAESPAVLRVFFWVSIDRGENPGSCRLLFLCVDFDSCSWAALAASLGCARL